MRPYSGEASIAARAVVLFACARYVYIRCMIDYLSNADTILKLFGTLASVLAAFFGLRSLITKQKAEAMKQVQDVYQETIEDLRKDRREMRSEFEGKIQKQDERLNSQSAEIGQLKEALRDSSERLSKVDAKVTILETQKCLVKNCPKRQQV